MWGYIKLPGVLCGCLKLSKAFWGYLELSKAICGDLETSRARSGYLWLFPLVARADQGMVGDRVLHKPVLSPAAAWPERLRMHTLASPFRKR